MTLGERIRVLRNSRNVSLRRLSEITGVSKTTLSDIENDTKNTSLETIEKIARAFGLTTAQLLSDVQSSADLIALAEKSSSDLMSNFSKSENLVRTLYRAKDKPKEVLDEMALFLETYLRTKGLYDEDKNEDKK